MIILPCFPTFGRFFQPGFAIPAAAEYLRFATMPQDRRQMVLRLPIQSVSIGNAASRAYSRIAGAPPNTDGDIQPTTKLHS
jgi:hypothetical protein